MKRFISFCVFIFIVSVFLYSCHTDNKIHLSQGNDETKTSETSPGANDSPVDISGFVVTVPSGFTVTLKGVMMTPEKAADPEDDGGFLSFRIGQDDSYSENDLMIFAPDGREAEFVISGRSITPALVLPESVTVTIDGALDPGIPLENGSVFHHVGQSGAHKYILSDGFGHQIEYSKNDVIPMTEKIVRVPDGYTVSVDGKPVPEDQAERTKSDVPDEVAEFCNIPDVLEYDVAVLAENATFTVTDDLGVNVEADTSKDVIDVSLSSEVLPSVPDEISSQINVLEVAETWSKFMSADLYGYNNGFGTLAAYLIEGTELYNYALAWANGIDITFTSIHVLTEPPFTEEKVTNFRMLSDDCFCCDVHLVKQMILDNGESRSDPMDSTLYFVKTNGGAAPEWKLIYMLTDVSENNQTISSDGYEIELYEISGATYKANLLVIKDPSRVSVATIYPWRETGETLDVIAQNAGAIAAINGGIYNSYVNKGGQPYGVVVSNGEIQYNSPQDFAGLVLIGFTEEDHLEIVDIDGWGPADVEQFVKERHIRDAVTFQEDATDVNNHFVQLITDGEPRDLSSGIGAGLNPRTVIGQREDGAVLMLVTDGRGKNNHLGASASDLIWIMKKYGAVNAANLDGGSSSCMYYDGEYLMTSVTFYYSDASWNLPLAFVVK